MSNKKTLEEIEVLCKKFRKEIIEMLHSKQTGHPGGSLSAVEILSVIYFLESNIDASDINNPNRDRVVLSKGHAAPILYIILSEMGLFDKKELDTFRQLGSILQGHPTFKTPGIDAITGPLGLGISYSAGMALGMKLNNVDSRVYCLLGDGEMQEGVLWETTMSAVKFKQDNLICILDHNGVQLDGQVKDIMSYSNDIVSIFNTFGWKTFDVDGHDVKAVSEVLKEARTVKGQPIFVNAKTVKGEGVSFMENQNAWHGKPIDKESYDKAIQELGG